MSCRLLTVPVQGSRRYGRACVCLGPWWAGGVCSGRARRVTRIGRAQSNVVYLVYLVGAPVAPLTVCAYSDLCTWAVTGGARGGGGCWLTCSLSCWLPLGARCSGPRRGWNLGGKASRATTCDPSGISQGVLLANLRFVEAGPWPFGALFFFFVGWQHHICSATGAPKQPDP